MSIVCVALGSACGGLLRWAVGIAAGRLFGTSLPYGTFIINITGSLFLGWFLTRLDQRPLGASFAWPRTDDLRLLIAVGFTGAYTTFSTFEWEAHGLLRDGETTAGTMYLVGSVLVGVLAVRLGVALGRMM
ncbi:MAG TPA: fluoride efflux transporter CrcB [Pirellulales bacterium]